MSFAATAWTLASRTVRDAWRNRITGLAAEVAFFALLSVPPLLLVLGGLAGYVSDIFGPVAAQEIRDWIMTGLGGFLDAQTLEDLVRPTVDDIFAEGRGGLISVGALLALWSSSRLIRVLIEAMNHAYDVETWRPGWKRRLMALGMTLGGVVAIIVILPLIVAGPQLGHAIDRRLGLEVLDPVWSVAYWPAAIISGIALLTTLYHFAPNWQTRWLRDLPGAVFAAVAWIAAAGALRLYVSVSFGDSVAGPLAAPAVVLLWFYASAFVVILGAELNAEIERMWPSGDRGTVDP